MSERQRVVILGAGFAGLETAFLLRMRLRDRVDLTLVSERAAFTFRPNTIYVPFGADPAELMVDLASRSAGVGSISWRAASRVSIRRLTRSRCPMGASSATTNS